MSRHVHPPKKRSTSTSEWKPGRGTRVVLVLVAGSVGLVSAAYPHGYGWAGAVLAALSAIAVPVVAYRSYWNQPRFWIPFILLAALQVPAVIAIRPVVENLRFPALFIFGITDCIVVITAIYWVIYWPRSPHIRG
jgi:hypothetical protein